MTAVISYADALKAFRRGVHVHKADWRGLVLCETAEKMQRAVQEAKHIFDASSLEGQYHITSQRFVFLPSSATLRFMVCKDMLEAYMLQGSQFPHVIWLFTPRSDVQQYVESLSRSAAVPQPQIRIDYSGL